MNFLRLRPIVQMHTIRTARSYVTANSNNPPFVPPASLETIDPLPINQDTRLKPETLSFYTTRPQFYDRLRELEKKLHDAQAVLRAAHIFPFPDQAKDYLPPNQSSWLKRKDMAGAFGITVTASGERQIHDLLDQLNHARRVATAAGEDEVAIELNATLRSYEHFTEDQLKSRGRRKPVKFDEEGRSYALGRRKESSARVWVVPVIERAKDQVPTTSILINNLPIAKYFPNITDRNLVVRPFKLAGLFGAFNAFALVRGGGTSGQAGAIAHGIAQSLAARVPEVQMILRRAHLLKRDPRMVERKKTGLAKARKRYAWVKR